MTRHFDAIIIGAGQAGPSLAGRLTGAGMTVAVIERHLIGGTCVNTGCKPTKTLVASAYVAHQARRGADYGVITGPVSIDMARVHARSQKISVDGRTSNEAWLRSMAGCTLIFGHARFEGARTVRVGEDLLEADRVFINVGGRAVVPDMPGVGEVPFFTNSSLLSTDLLPDHLVVVGGSYIGLEFAQIYARFGARVTVVEKGPRLIGREDADVCREGEPEIIGSHLLLAVGRRPNTDDLGLEKGGVATDARGYIQVNDRLETNVAGIWALGDCNGRGAFTHTAYNDFEIVAANLLDGEARGVSQRIPAYALYIDPPLGRVGITETEARASGRPLLVGHRPMTRVGRAVEKDETKGFMKVVVDAETSNILGAAILGTGGDEAIHGILDVMNAGIPYTALQRAVPIHPTVSELIPTMLGEMRAVPQTGLSAP